MAAGLAGGRARVSAFAVALALVASGCGGGGGLGLVSTDDEVEFGRQGHEEITNPNTEGGYAVCEVCGTTQVGGTTITAYVENLGQSLGAIGNPDRGSEPSSPGCAADPNVACGDQIPAWHFTVLESNEINAFALPGGYIYVTTGLLAMVQNKAELAGIIGHEVAHVTQYHGVQRIETFMLLSGFSTLIFGSESDMGQAVAQFLANVDNLVSSQDDELEADRYGVRYAFEDTWNPLEMNNFFRDIRDMYGEPQSQLSRVLSSHPPPSERIDQVEETATGLGITADDPNLRKDDPNLAYAQVRQAVQPFVPAASEDNVAFLDRIPPRLRPYVHACTFDPITRRMVHRHQ